MTQAIFAAGCFWHVEATFRQVSGVTNVTCGYIGGDTQNPTYEQVCKHNTGHAEAVLVEYDEAAVSYELLLETFWQCHNPTTKNRQGNDIGSQYRSAVFYTDDTQRTLAEKDIERLNQDEMYDAPIVTEVTKASTFYPAEEYHQRYFEKNNIAHCSLSKE